MNTDWKYAVSSALLTFTKSVLLFLNIHRDKYTSHCFLQLFAFD